MAFGALLRNRKGKQILYGAEAIPICMAAFKFSLSKPGVYEKTLNIPYQTDIACFIRSDKTSVEPIRGGRFPTPLAGFMGHPIVSNKGGKLHIKLEALTPSTHDPAFGFPTNFWFGSGRLYVVGRQPNIKPKGWGMVIYGDDNKVSFSTEGVMAPVNEVKVARADQLGTFSPKTASILSIAGNALESRGGGFLTYYNYMFLSAVVCKDGKVRLHVSGRAVTPMPPSAGGWGVFEPKTTFVSMDTTYADRKFFGD